MKFFETVRYLSEQEQERYCVFKSVELLYLLCTEVSESDESLSGSGCPVSHSLLEVKAYIQTHLSDKLTIALLCKQFSVSPTFLKEAPMACRFTAFWFNSASDGHRS